MCKATAIQWVPLNANDIGGCHIEVCDYNDICPMYTLFWSSLNKLFVVQKASEEVHFYIRVIMDGEEFELEDPEYEFEEEEYESEEEE